MKRFVSVILILVTMLALFACANGGDGEEVVTTTKEVVTARPKDTNKNPNTTTPSTTQPSTTVPAVTEPPIKGTLAKFNLGIGTVSSGNYRFAAYELSEKKFYELEAAKRSTWSSDYPGHHMIYRPDIYTVSKSEGTGIVDLMCTANYGSAVVYTAYDNGSATIVAEAYKLWANDVKLDVLLLKGDGTVLAEERNISNKKNISFEETVKLVRGDIVFLLVKYSDTSKKESGQNVVLKKFEVYLDKHKVSQTTKLPSVTDDNITAWATHSYDKIVLNAPNNTGTTKYTVNMAKNETEGCQLVVMNSASSGSKKGKLVLVSAPGGSISSSMYMLDNYETVNGNQYTDACRPYYGTQVTIGAGSVLPFLIEFTTSAATPMGDQKYVYAFVNDKGKAVALFEVTVHVWNITLPTDKTFRTAAGLDNWMAVVHEGKQNASDAEYLELLNSYYGFMLEHNLSPYHLPADILNNYADKYMSNPAVTFFLVPCIGDDGNLLPDSEILKYYKKLKTNKTWLSKAVFYPLDEPHTKEQVEKYNQFCEHLRKLCPDIPVIAPYYTNFKWETGISGALSKDDQTNHMYNDSGIWCPKLCLWDDDQAYYDFGKYVRPDQSYADRMEAKRAEGSELWTYVCNDPDDPYSQLFVDTLGQNQRLLFWQIYQRNISGFLYWGTNKWVQYNDYTKFIDPWESLDNGLVDANGNKVIGEGNIFYPGKPAGVEGPVASLRLKYIRDGIDDIELMYLAEKYLGESWVKEKTNGATSSLTSFSDADTLAAIRKEIGDALEKKINK
ncbi:MAG: DUF4091 domain-containing protein [Clostridia bacterium]|nr:DUF4091 domain-containing protein [Clostridia bacterium]